MELTAQVLRDLPVMNHPNLIVGADHFEDGGVYRLGDDLAIVQTVDFFPPLVDDPYVFGQIAAANSLSDVYAMGGSPVTALNLVGFPDKELHAEVLSRILAGGAERVQSAGAVVVGGHSVRDAEIKYGLAVTGTIHPDKVIGNNTVQPHDALVLTKPIGSGVLTSAAKTGAIDEADLTEAIEVMIALNDGACAAMIEVGVHAATDITGFGLLGHAFEMAQASGVAIQIHAESVPLLNQCLGLADRGILTRTHRATRAHLGDRLHIANVRDTLVSVLADAQTSGGLLIAVAPDRTDHLVEELTRRRASCAVVIGEAITESPGTIRLA